MSTLADVALTVATYLGRVNADATLITDLESEIKDEIGNTIKYYNRRPIHLTEVRGGELTTVASTTWYSSVDVTSGAGDQALSGRSTMDVNNIIKIHYMRENPGASGLNEPLSFVPYQHFERMFEGSTPQGQLEYFTLYAGQIGIWPTPNAAHTLYWSGIVKPVVPTSDSDESVWFDQANELIEAGAAKRVCTKYLRDMERAQVFGAMETGEYSQLKSEHIKKSSSGRIKAHE